MNGYDVKVLADSLSPANVRLTTFEVTFPRFILAEFNTHRVLSRNSASSRAIPVHKQVERVLTTPFVPEEWGSAQKGMVPGNSIAEWKALLADALWKGARYPAVWAAKGLEKLNVHKSYANRLLEPWMWHTVIVSATKWDNFFALRMDEGAQAEFRIAATAMYAAYMQSEPEILSRGDEHLPLVFDEDKAALPPTDWAMLSAGRCARVSFDRQHDAEPRSDSMKRGLRLTKGGHWSPWEHQAMVMDSDLAKPFNGNFHGDWAQARKFFDYEDNFNSLKKYGAKT